MPAISQLITAAIVAIVVLVSLKASGGVIAHAADKLADITGVPLGPPSIKAFTATPDGNGNMRFMVSLAHSTSDVELLIYQLYIPTPDKELGAPDFKKENIVFDLIADTSKDSGQKLTAELEKGVINHICPKEALDSQGNPTADKNGCSMFLPYKPGGYKFLAVLKKGGKVVDSRDAVTGFYDESYVELLNAPVKDCIDSWGNCNVAVCKKVLVNYNLAGGAAGGFPSWLGIRKNLVPKIYADFKAMDFAKLFGKSLSSGCGDFSEGVIRLFKVDKCTPEELDLLNTMVARARLLEAANNYENVNSEDDYSKHIDELDLWKGDAVRFTLSCTQPLGRMITTDPKGAHPELQKLGWQLVAPDGKTDIWKGKVNAELDRVLNSVVRPAITNYAAVTNSEKQVALAWNVPIGKASLTAYKLKLFYSGAAVDEKLADAKKQADAKKLGLQEITLPKQPVKGDLSLKYPNTGGLASQQMGAYWFELTALDSQGEASKVEAHTGMYDNNFIENYRDLKGVDDACGSGCDVAGKKENALGNDNIWPYTKKAFNKHKDEFQASCHLEPKKKGEERISGCLPSEVDVLYRDAVTGYVTNLPSGDLRLGKTVADVMKFDCWTETWMNNYQSRFVDTGIKPVCDAKGNLKSSLDKLHWGYTGS